MKTVHHNVYISYDWGVAGGGIVYVLCLPFSTKN